MSLTRVTLPLLLLSASSLAYSQASPAKAFIIDSSTTPKVVGEVAALYPDQTQTGSWVPQFTPLVFLKIAGQLAPVWVTPNVLEGTAVEAAVYFASTDCTGEGWVYLDPGVPVTILQLTYVVGQTRSVYIATKTPGSSFTYGSALAQAPGCLVQSGTQTLTPATKLADIGSQFTPPFRAFAH
jgi:hypothetical protein